MRFFLIMAMLLLPPVLEAKMSAPGPLLAAGNANQLLPGQKARITNKRAASLVKQHYRSSKILSINLIRSKGPPVYRVKTLSSSGVVRYVYVDGITGDVFE